MDLDYLKIFLTVAISILGWLVAHHFTSKRDLELKRRDISLEHLISAYRILADEISQRKLDATEWRKLEKLITDIQLFGSKEQLRLAKELVHNLSTKKDFELDPLIKNLRKDLRCQLKLEFIDENVAWLRYGERAKQDEP